MKILTLLLALSLSPSVHADEKPAGQQAAPVYEITATGDIEIGPDGRVHHYELDKGQLATIEQALARSIEQWRFEPITVDGRPVIAATRMRVEIEALPTPDGNYRLRVDGVHFGAPSRNAHDLTPPRYPPMAVRAGVGGQVVLVLKLDEQGKVVRVHTEQVNLQHDRARSKRNAQRWREQFAEVSMAVAEKWTFDINETIGGKPIGGSVRVPVAFNLGYDGASENTWRKYVSGPRHPIPWVTGNAVVAVDGTPLADGEVRSLSSRFQLTTDLVDTLL